MNEFANLMTSKGVRPLSPSAQPVQPQPATTQAAPPAPLASPPNWVIGKEGIDVLERAMRCISRNGVLRRPNGQIVMLVRREGMLIDAGDPGTVVTASDLLKIADQIDCEMIIISWDDRKAVFHPTSGAAVITVNPREA